MYEMTVYRFKFTIATKTLNTNVKIRVVAVRSFVFAPNRVKRGKPALSVLFAR